MFRKIDWESQIGRRLKLRDLHVFLTVVQCRSMAKAAQQLGVSQPAVSEVIADLEHALGVRLVDRSARGVDPTIYGGALLKRSIAAFDELKQSIRDIEFLSNPTAGEVRIGAPMAAAVGFISTAIVKLAERQPRVVCHLLTGESAMIYRALEEREVDLVCSGPVATALTEDHLQTEVLYPYSNLVVAAIGNPWSRRRKVGLADLMNEPWTLPPRDSSPLGVELVGYFRAAGLDVPRATVITYTDIARVALVAKSRFLTICGHNALRFGGWDTAIKALPIDLPAAHGSVVIVTLKNRTPSPVAQLFIDYVREATKPLARDPSGSARDGGCKNHKVLQGV